MAAIRRAVPAYHDLLWPTLQVLCRLSEPGRLAMIRASVAEDLALSDDTLEVRTLNGTHYAYNVNMGWALTHLKKAGLADNPEYGMWISTEAGRAVETEQVVRELCNEYWLTQDTNATDGEEIVDDAPEPPDYEKWYRERFGDARVWLMAPGLGGELWGDFLRDGNATIGWDTGDLGKCGSYEDVRDAWTTARGYNNKNPVQVVCMLIHFGPHSFYNISQMREGDIIVAKRGINAILGVGTIRSDYEYDANRQHHRHTRTVEWTPCDTPLILPDWLRRIPRKTLTNYTGCKDWLYAIFRLIDGKPPVPPPHPPPPRPGPYSVEDALEELFVGREHFERILSVLTSRKNLILQGPPGTGKTFMARRLAWCLIGLMDSQSIEVVQFHQSYAYEDFVQGYRPTDDGGFTLKNGVFYEFCERAREDEGTPYVFIIDEINRGNMSRIFGELLMLIEADKRTEEYAASLTYGKPGKRFCVPPNVYILGLMNTADRSLAVVDYALRRRFAFEDLVPAFNSPKFKAHLLNCEVDEETIQLIQDRMGTVNKKIRDDAELGSGFEIGHSYFVPAGPEALTDEWYEEVVDTQIAPLLREYWFDNLGQARREIDKMKVERASEGLPE